MKKIAVFSLLFACMMTHSAALWQTHALVGTQANCLAFSVPVVVHDGTGEQRVIQNQSLRFSVTSTPDSGVGVFNDNGSNLGSGAVSKLATQGISSSTRNSTTTALSCTDDLWDVNFVVRRNGNAIGDKVTFFVIKPDGNRLDIASFITESGGARFTNLSGAGFGLSNRLLTGGLLTNNTLIPFSAAGGTQTALITSSIIGVLPKPACSRFGIEITRGNNEGTTSVAIADVVVDRAPNGPTATGPALDADGSIHPERTGTYPIGLTCPTTCPSACPMPTPSCPLPTPTPKPTPTPTPTPAPGTSCYCGIKTDVTATVTITQLSSNQLCFTIKNTSTGKTSGTITNIGFNLPGNRPNIYKISSATNKNYFLAHDLKAISGSQSFGDVFDFVLGNNSGKTPNFNDGKVSGGIAPNQSASFCITGDFSSLTLQQITQGIYLRFQDVDKDDNSKDIANKTSKSSNDDKDKDDDKDKKDKDDDKDDDDKDDKDEDDDDKDDDDDDKDDDDDDDDKDDKDDDVAKACPCR